MSTTVYIMRHGIAEDRGPSGRDADRRLTDEGRSKVLAIARGLRTLGVAPKVVLSSPLPRAMETATLAASVLQGNLDVVPCPVLGLDYDAPAVVAALEKYSGREGVLLVGHQPQLGEIASFLLTGSTALVPLAFKKGAVAAIQVEALPPRFAGSLLWFATPKQLRGLADQAD